VRKGDDLEKARKVADVARQPFGLHFLLEIESRVGREGIGGIGGHGDQRYEPLAQRRREIERRQFGRHEGVHGAHDRTTGQEVRAAATELPCARPGEGKLVRSARLDQVMHHRQ